MATYIVSKLADELEAADTDPATFDPNDLSLREALALANDDPATLDSITFDPNLAGGSNPGVDDGVIMLGGTELLISGNVAIDGDVDGDGTADITISAASLSRVINIDGASPIYAVLNGLIIQDGVTAGSGGGIIVGVSDTLTLTNATLQNNAADTSGGGLAIAGSASLNDVTFMNNDGGVGADGGGIYNVGFLLADRLTIVGSDTGAHGGALMNAGSAVLTNSTLSANTAGVDGGAINSVGALTLYNTTVSENFSNRDGGGLYNGASAVLTNTTLWGNVSQDDGGGLFNGSSGSATLTNATVTGNAAVGSGGGIYVATTGLTLANSIVVGNAANNGGHDVDGAPVLAGGNIVGNALTSGSTTVASGFAPDDVFASVVAVDPDGPGGIPQTLAGTLANNGSKVQTVALEPGLGGPAVDAGDADVLDETQPGVPDLNGDGDELDTVSLDARGYARAVDAGGSAHAVDLGAFEQQSAAAQIVTTLDDELDSLDPNATLLDFGGPGDLSLREALALANADPTNADQITFDPSFSQDTIALTLGELVITSDVTISGGTDAAGLPFVGLSGAGSSRIFNINGSAGSIAVTINGLALIDGYTSGNGGAIAVGAGDHLTLTNSVLDGNAADGGMGGGIYGGVGATITADHVLLSDNSAGLGGGIYLTAGASLALRNATLVANSATLGGGGIYGVDGTSLALTNTTLFGNSAGIDGGAIMTSFGAVLALTNSTVTGNSADNLGGGIKHHLGNGSVTLSNTIVAGNFAGTGGHDLQGSGTDTLTFLGSNITGSGAAGFNSVNGAATAQIDGSDEAALGTVFASVSGLDLDGPGGNPEFFAGTPGYHGGGLVPTVAINPDGIARDSGDDAAAVYDDDGNGATPDVAIPTDARGFGRVTGTQVDIGAFEQQNAEIFLVTTLEDQLDSLDPNATLADFGGPNDLSLREALALANRDATTADTIRFDPTMDPEPLVLTMGALVISGSVTIDGDVGGNATPDITIDANGASGALMVQSGIVTLNDLTLTGGDAYAGGGLLIGSIFDPADVTVTNSAIIGNYAGVGGGIMITPFSSLRLVNSTVSGNQAYARGGAIYNVGGTLAIIDSTLSGNSADLGSNGYGYGGGGLYNDGAATLINTTLSGNSGGYAGGGIANSGELTLINTTLANNDAAIGGGLYNAACGCGDATLLNTTVSGNHAANGGGGIAVYAGAVAIINSIVAGNSAGAGAADIDGAVSLAGVNVLSQAGIGRSGIDIHEADISRIFAAVDGTTGGGQLADNGGPVQTIALNGAGVAINAGDDAELPADAENLDGDADTAEDLPLDARGLPRVYGGTVDVGAFELQNSVPTLVANTGLTLSEGAGATITAAALAYTDAEEAATAITYTITAAAIHGTLSRAGVALGLGATFTQADIDNSLIAYAHDGGEAAGASFGFAVSDGVTAALTGSFAFTIDPVNDAPVNAVPGAQQLEANTPTAISGLSIADADAGAGATTVLTVTHGTLGVVPGGGGVSGNGSATLTLSGTVAQINAALASLVYTGAQDYFGSDTLRMTTSDNGHAGSGGALADTDSVAITIPQITGTSGADSYPAPSGNERIDGSGGRDTITFGFRLTEATITWSGNRVIVDGPSSHTVLTGFETYVFTDGTVHNDDGDPLVDDLFYYARNPDLWNAGVDAEAHYHSLGWRESRDPNAFFSTSTYLSANPDVAAAGVNPLAHFDATGWQEGRVPSIAFDPGAYRAAYADVAAAQVDPLRHFLTFGAEEGRQPIAPADLVAANGFDYVHYLQHNPDVAAARVDPLAHFLSAGWREGRDPNALFDTSGYLATYGDVAAADVNPLEHFDAFGWREGRDPSVGFDTTAYLSAYPDIAAADINPLVHFLRFGIHEGRQPFGDGSWG